MIQYMSHRNSGPNSSDLCKYAEDAEIRNSSRVFVATYDLYIPQFYNGLSIIWRAHLGCLAKAVWTTNQNNSIELRGMAGTTSR